MRRSLQATRLLAIAGLAAIAVLSACTQEQQNKFGRGVQNWTGTDGVLDVYAGEKLAMRFIDIDKMTTGIAVICRLQSEQSIHQILRQWLSSKRWLT